MALEETFRVSLVQQPLLHMRKVSPHRQSNQPKNLKVVSGGRAITPTPKPMFLSHLASWPMCLEQIRSCHFQKHCSGYKSLISHGLKQKRGLMVSGNSLGDSIFRHASVQGLTTRSLSVSWICFPLSRLHSHGFLPYKGQATTKVQAHHLSAQYPQ